MMTRSRKFLAAIVLIAPFVIVIGDLFYFMYPYLFVNRHLPNYVLRNQIMDTSFYAALTVGVVGGAAMFFLEKRPKWLAVSVITILLAIASVYLSAGFGIAMMH